MPDRLIIPVAGNDDVIAKLDQAARVHNLEIVPPRVQQERTAMLIRLRPRDGAAANVDAWSVLQDARAASAPGELDGVGLDHLVLGHRSVVGGTPHNEPHDDPAGAALAGGYPMSAYAGPRPVGVVMAPPKRTESPCHRPVVAVVDTGCGSHPWLMEGVDKKRAGYLGPTPEDGAMIDIPMYGVLGPGNGHGTRICGVVRQIFPDADLLPACVLGPDALAAESDLIDTLEQTRDLAQRYLHGDRKKGHRIDVINLSCGYYPEELELLNSHTLIQQVLRELGDLGVVVVASAGNNATTRPTFPAAFAPHTGGPDPDHCSAPLISVGALNPDGSVALFSNSGNWVRHFEIGSAVVSPMPTFDFSLNPLAETNDPSGRVRKAIDPDHYRGLGGKHGGFALSSGTSFAAPVLAGRIARELAKHPSHRPGKNNTHCEPSVDRAWAAVEAVTSLKRPPRH